MLSAMARSTIRFLKQQGRFNTNIADVVGCDRHTVARALAVPDEPARRRHRLSTLEARRAEVRSWLEEAIPTRRMLELVRQDPTAPYQGGASTFYHFVARLRAETAAGAAPIIRFEGLPGEYVQWDWGEAKVPLGGTRVKRVFLAGRLKYSRLSGVRWRTQMDLETLCRAMREIVEGWGGVPWAWVFDNMKTVTLGREADGTPRWNPAFWLTTRISTPNERVTLAGLGAVHVVVNELGAEAAREGLTRSSLQAELESRLRQAGLRVLTPDEALTSSGRPTLELRVTLMRSAEAPQLYVYGVALALRQQIRLTRDRAIESFAVTWSEDPEVGTVGAGRLAAVRDVVRAKVGRFITAWQTVNLGG